MVKHSNDWQLAQWKNY